MLTELSCSFSKNAVPTPSTIVNIAFQYNNIHSSGFVAFLGQ